jgi:RNA polymerase sigma-70 factor (ECF subfamily)
VDTHTHTSGHTNLAQVPVTEAYEAFAAELHRFATARTRDAGSAEDLVHEAFVRLSIESRAGRSPTNPKAWLYRVVHNLIVSRSRRADVARRHAAHLEVDDILVASPEVVVLSSERNRALGTALQVIGAPARASLILAAQGYTSREIGERLGRSEGATRTIICRARKVVRNELINQQMELV